MLNKRALSFLLGHFYALGSRLAFFCVRAQSSWNWIDLIIILHDSISPLPPFFLLFAASLSDTLRISAPIRSRDGASARRIVPGEQHSSAATLWWPSRNRCRRWGNGTADAAAALRSTGRRGHQRFHSEQSVRYPRAQTLETVLGAGLQVE